MKSGVAVEKLLRAKSAKIRLRQDALKTTFSIFKAFCTPQISALWEKTGLFQQTGGPLLYLPASVPGRIALSRVAGW